MMFSILFYFVSFDLLLASFNTSNDTVDVLTVFRRLFVIKLAFDPSL